MSFDTSELRVTDGRLHPIWAYLLMTLCVNAAILVGAYAVFETGWVRGLGFLAVAGLVGAAATVYRSA